MRCPHCQSENEEGAAVCASCDEPLTAYGGQWAGGEVNPATLAKLARLDSRPQVVPAMTALLVLLALFGPFAAVLTKFATRTVTNAEGTNYAGAAFGAVGIVFTALFMVPLGLALLYLAWATWQRATWAWMANAVLLGAVLVLSLIGFLASGLLLRLLLIIVCAAAGWFWLKPGTREWYGA